MLCAGAHEMHEITYGPAPPRLAYVDIEGTLERAALRACSMYDRMLKKGRTTTSILFYVRIAAILALWTPINAMPTHTAREGGRVESATGDGFFGRGCD